MAGAKRSTWVGATVAAAVVIGAATWFVAVAPVRASAADLRSQTADTEAQNVTLQHKVTQLKADYAKLPEYQQQLDALRVQIPTTAQLSDYVRQVDQIAAAHGVTIVSVTPGDAEAFVPAATATPKPTATPSASATPTAEATIDPTAEDPGTATKPKTPAPSGVPDGFAAIPVALDVVGTYDNTLAFISDLQTATPRLFLLSGLVATAQLQDQSAGGGKPEMHVGDQELVLNGFLYALPEGASAASASTPTSTPTPPPALPGAVPGKNPLVPVAGQ